MALNNHCLKYMLNHLMNLRQNPGVATFTRAPFATDFFRHRFFRQRPVRHRLFRHRPLSSEVPLATVFFHQRYTFATEFFCQRNISPPLHFHQSLLGKKSIKSTENLSMHKIFQICKSINEIVEIICHQVVFDQEGRVFALWIWCTSEFQEAT